MRKGLKLLFSGYLIFLIGGVLSCSKTGCGDYPDKYKASSIEWKNYRAVHSNGSFNRSDILNDTVSFSEYCIYIKINTVQYHSSNYRSPSWNLINPAFACSPAPPTTDERIDSIVIVSQQNFSPGFPAGTNLAALFNVDVSNSYNGTNYFTDSPEYLLTNPEIPDSPLLLILNSPPAEQKEYSFTVKYYQNGIDLDYYEFTTDKIVILNN